MGNIDNRYYLRATGITQSSLLLEWQNDSMEAPHYNIIYYIYENNIQKYSRPTNSPFLYVTELLPGTEYRYQIKRVNTSTGEVISQSNIIFVTTESYHNSYNLRASDITQTSLLLEWLQGNLYPSAPHPDRRYDIYENNILKYSQASSFTFLDITGLTPGTEYHYQVKSVKIETGDAISQSDILAVTTERHEDKYNLRASNITQTSLLLEWLQGNLYPSAPHPDRRYDIYENNTLKYSQASSFTFLDITGLTPGTEYHYQVKSVKIETADVISQSDILAVMTQHRGPRCH
ncbi:fibronectin type III domain-containing protein [uncultured Cedecea sp.]|uniref:fibronectin type III domain-containing protein n=1 Tax=uncultured Cedecea sp. TaxID=988762 RepID=UPI0026358423|nr:fibronectin type III domain-containing protein [uncultured Cedecea sp.]